MTVYETLALILLSANLLLEILQFRHDTDH